MAAFSKLKELLGGNKAQTEYFLAININQEQVEVCLWGVVENQTLILGVAVKDYSGFDNLPFAVSEAIDEANEGNNIEVRKTIFGLPDNWITNDKVDEPYAHLIRNLSKDLTLEPLAFVATSKAIAHFLFQDKLSPVNAIIIGVTSQSANISLVDNNKIVASRTIREITHQLVDEIKGVINSFQTVNNILPPLIVLYGSFNLEEVRDKLSSSNWPLVTQNESTTGFLNPVFLHQPKIEVLEPGSQGKAVAIAGITDLGFPLPKTLMPMLASHEKQSISTSLEGQKNEFGFVQGRDVSVNETDQLPSSASTPSLITKLIYLLGNAWQKFILYFSAKRPIILLPVISVLAVVILILVLYWFLPTAKVEIYVNSQTLTQEAEIIATPNTSAVDEEKGKIPAQLLESVQKGTQKAVATGKKIVGDKARGTVTIFNKTTAPKTFNAGVIITQIGSGLKFRLASNVTVASRSATLEGITYGKSQVDVVAEQVGTESNINAGGDFVIDEFDVSLYSAHNDQPFTGGTSREVTIVLEDDLKKLEESLASDLLSKAKEDFNSKIKSNYKLLDDAISSVVISKTFDKKAGDEATIISLTLEMNFKTTVYDENDLKKVLVGYLRTKVPKDFQLVESGIETTTNRVRLSNNGDLVFNAELKAKVIPVLDTEQIQHDLVGKKPSAVENYLTSLPDVVSSNLQLSPRLPLFLTTMPRLAKRIEVVIIPK